MLSQLEATVCLRPAQMQDILWAEPRTPSPTHDPWKEEKLPDAQRCLGAGGASKETGGVPTPGGLQVALQGEQMGPRTMHSQAALKPEQGAGVVEGRGWERDIVSQEKPGGTQHR